MWSKLESKTRWNMKKFALWTMVIAIYCNIGWGIGTYIHTTQPHTDNQITAPATTMAKILAGPRNFLKADRINSLRGDRVVMTLFWPFELLFVAIAWGIAAIWFMLKLIFAGGLIKLAGGLGNFLGVLVVFIIVTSPNKGNTTS